MVGSHFSKSWCTFWLLTHKQYQCTRMSSLCQTLFGNISIYRGRDIYRGKSCFKINTIDREDCSLFAVLSYPSAPLPICRTGMNYREWLSTIPLTITSSQWLYSATVLTKATFIHLSLLHPSLGAPFRPGKLTWPACGDEPTKFAG